MKNSFLTVLLAIEGKMKETKYQWLKIFFALPTHHFLHLFDKWVDFGSFADNWCFGMEREKWSNLDPIHINL